MHAVDGLLVALTLTDSDAAPVPCVLLCILFFRYKQTETTLTAKTDDTINSTSTTTSQCSIPPPLPFTMLVETTSLPVQAHQSVISMCGVSLLSILLVVASLLTVLHLSQYHQVCPFWQHYKVTQCVSGVHNSNNTIWHLYLLHHQLQ